MKNKQEFSTSDLMLIETVVTEKSETDSSNPDWRRLSNRLRMKMGYSVPLSVNNGISNIVRRMIYYQNKAGGQKDEAVTDDWVRFMTPAVAIFLKEAQWSIEENSIERLATAEVSKILEDYPNIEKNVRLRTSFIKLRAVLQVFKEQSAVPRHITRWHMIRIIFSATLLLILRCFDGQFGRYKLPPVARFLWRLAMIVVVISILAKAIIVPLLISLHI